MKLDLNKFEAVIFDMDGTMIDNTPFHSKAWLEFCKRHDIELTEEEYHQKISGRSNDVILANLFGRKVEGEEYEKFDEEKESIYRELFAPNFKEVAGIKDFLKKLDASGIKVGVATTAPLKNSRKIRS